MGGGRSADRFLHATRTFAGAEKERGIGHGSVLSFDRDAKSRLTRDLSGRIFRELVEALVSASRHFGEQLTLLGQSFFVGAVIFGRAKYLHGHHGVHHELVAGIVDLQHDVGPECFDGVEEHRAGMDAEVALALIEHDVVLFQIHRTTGEHAGPGGDREGRGRVAHLYLVQQVPTREPIGEA